MKTLYPYRTIRDVTLRVTDFHLDGGDASHRVNTLEAEVDLAAVEPSTDWEIARIEFLVEAPADALDAMDDVECLVIADCGRSNHRQAVRLDRQQVSQGRWQGQMVLEHDLWFGQASVRAVIMATVDEIDHRAVGTSNSWSLAFDDLPNRPTKGAIQITWVDFSAPGDKRYLKKFVDNAAFLKVDPYEPQLFLNSSFDGLPALLSDDRRRRGLDKALHDQVRSALADKAWVALFNTALQSVETDEDNRPLWPTIEWQQTVLRVLLARMYDTVTPDEALETAWNASRSEAAGDLQAELWPAAATEASGPKLLRESIRAWSRTLDEGEGS